MKNCLKFYSSTILSGVILLSPVSATADEDIEDLAELSLTQLMEVEVTSVSKRAEKANETAAAIYVVTAEDIKNSGFTTIPETLRMVPGIQVSRMSSNVWAVTARGFAEDFNKKLLVLIDGRSVYNPLFSGVLWEEQGVPMENIERIEVIRGPGATLWGANAVNGVINIITKHTEDNQGTTLSAGAGTFEKATGLAKHGGYIDEDTSYSAYAQYYDQRGTKSNIGRDKNDDWDIGRVGFRTDSYIDDSSSIQVQGDFYKGERDLENDLLPNLAGALTTSGLVTPDQDSQNVEGMNILTKYNMVYDDDSELDVQFYYDRTARTSNAISYKIDTLDIEMQHFFDLDDRNEVIWGAGYRFIHDNVEETTFVSVSDNDVEETIQLFSGFIQDKIELSEDELYLTIGSKFEHNSYTGFEVQPNLRFTYFPAENQTIWGSVARAVRTPSRAERTFNQVLLASPALGPGFATLNGDEEFQSEELIAYELGYRFKPTNNSSIDMTAFYNDYKNLRSLEVASPFVLTADNRAEGEVAGFEVASNLQVNENLNFIASYSYLDMEIAIDAASTDTLSEGQEDSSPKHMFNIRSNYKISDDLAMNNAFYYVDRIKGASVGDYLRYDANVIWEATDGVELQLVGQNLLDSQHQEFSGSTYNSAAEIPRSFYGKVTVRF